MSFSRSSVLVPLLLMVVVLAPIEALAQRGGSGAPAQRPNTPFEDFLDALRLDLNTQVPEAQQLMVAGAKEAAPIVAEMFKVRQQLLNIEATNRVDDKPAALQAYAVLAAQMIGAEGATFGKIYALLRQNQQGRSPAGFAQMAGFFFPVAGAGRAGRGASGAALGRLDILTNLFTLDNAQKRDIREWLDASHKALADTRKGLTATRTALLDVIRSGQDPAAFDAAAAAYAVHATTMTDAEMTILARILQRLTPEQRANQQAINTSFALIRGFFINDRRWDIVPDGRGY